MNITMPITSGFGIIFDTQSGASRNWTVGPDGLRRFTDTGLPVDAQQAQTVIPCPRCGCTSADDAVRYDLCIPLPTFHCLVCPEGHPIHRTKD